MRNKQYRVIYLATNLQTKKRQLCAKYVWAGNIYQARKEADLHDDVIRDIQIVEKFVENKTDNNCSSRQ